MAVHFPYWIIHGNGDVGKDEKMDEEGRGEGFAKPIRTDVRRGGIATLAQ